MGLVEQLVFAGFLALGAALWWDAAQTMRATQAALSRSGQRLDYAEAALKEIQRETLSLRRAQAKKAGLRQAEARLSEATNLLLTRKEVMLA
jgi:hypothetical protein